MSLPTVIIQIPGGAEIELALYREAFELKVRECIAAGNYHVVYSGVGFELEHNTAVLESPQGFGTFLLFNITSLDNGKELQDNLDAYMKFANLPSIVAKTDHYQLIAMEYIDWTLEDYDTIMANL